jgi:diaminohydroxyphosphoribosylaminopyrimidine deaminase/5-amino-6-(5-phosphoribosylamino)uracil reductase
VKRVVIGIRDPYSKVDGKGIEYLQKHVVKIMAGLYTKEIQEDLKEFLERVKKGQP